MGHIYPTFAPPTPPSPMAQFLAGVLGPLPVTGLLAWLPYWLGQLVADWGFPQAERVVYALGGLLWLTLLIAIPWWLRRRWGWHFLAPGLLVGVLVPALVAVCVARTIDRRYQDMLARQRAAAAPASRHTTP